MRPALGAVALLAALGCAHAPASGSDLEMAYKQAVDSWTAKAEIYKFADEQAHFMATVESRVFRQQRVRERARQLGWTPAAEQAELTKELADADHETSFVVAVYTQVPRENDLGDTASIWRVALETPAGEVAPLSVDKLGRADANMQALYPYMDRFIRAYRIHFPKVAQGPVTLLIASGLGKAEMSFDQP